jgi:RNA polymerase sigma-70 factor, ECF subfamily
MNVPVFEHLNSPEFIRRLVGGEECAFRELFDTMHRQVAVFLQRRGILELDADELAADAFFKAHRAIRTFRVDNGAKLTTWIFEIAKNCAIDHVRVVARRNAEFAEIAAEQRQSNPDASEMDFVVRTSNRAALSVALETVSESDRNILRMRQVMEYSEIAAAERINEQAARVRYKRAFDRLKQAIVEGSQNGQNT